MILGILLDMGRSGPDCERSSTHLTSSLDSRSTTARVLSQELVARRVGILPSNAMVMRVVVHGTHTLSSRGMLMSASIVHMPVRARNPYRGILHAK